MLAKSFKRAFLELWISFQRTLKDIGTSFQRILKELSKAFKILKRSFTELLKGFYRASTEFFQDCVAVQWSQGFSPNILLPFKDKKMFPKINFQRWQEIRRHKKRNRRFIVYIKRFAGRHKNSRCRVIALFICLRREVEYWVLEMLSLTIGNYFLNARKRSKCSPVSLPKCFIVYRLKNLNWMNNISQAGWNCSSLKVFMSCVEMGHMPDACVCFEIS